MESTKLYDWLHQGLFSITVHLGSGYNGQVFAVPNILCDGDNNDKPSDIVLKLKIFPANQSDEIKFRTGRIGTYRSETDEQKHYALYERLVLADDPTAACHTLQHFALRLGTVDVPLHMVQNAVQSANLHLSMASSYRAMQFPVKDYPHNSNDKHGLSIQSQVFARVGGNTQKGDTHAPRNLRAVSADSKTTANTRQHIVRDLVFIYRHMYQYGVLVCDMKLEHFLEQSSTDHQPTTTMIDFDDFRYTVSSNHKRYQSSLLGKYAQQWQQWQLLVLLAHVCDYQSFTSQARFGKLLAPAGLASIACGAKGGDATLLPQAEVYFAGPLSKCGFSDDDDDDDDSSSNELWKAGNKTLEHTADFYQALTDWSMVH